MMLDFGVRLRTDLVCRCRGEAGLTCEVMMMKVRGRERFDG